MELYTLWKSQMNSLCTAKVQFMVLCLLHLWVVPVFCQESVSDPLIPDPESFIREVKKNAVSDRLLLRRYTYKETQTMRALNKDGEVRKTKLEVFEVFPHWDKKYVYRRLISKNGEPVSRKELEKQDRRHREKLEKQARKLAKKGAREREIAKLKDEEEGRKEKEVLDELFRLYVFKPLRREQIKGFSTILLEFHPKPEYKATTKEVKFLKKIRGRVWISEVDYQIVRVEAETIKTISWGLGILARLQQGTHMTFQRQKINDEIWLPSMTHLAMKGRILLLKGFRMELTSEYSDYRKFTVQSWVSFASSQ